MRSQSVGTERHVISVGHEVMEVHLAVPTQGRNESDQAYAERLKTLKMLWQQQGIEFADDENTAAGDAARRAIATVRQYIPASHRHLPIFEAMKRKRNKYPRRGH